MVEVCALLCLKIQTWGFLYEGAWEVGWFLRVRSESLLNLRNPGVDLSRVQVPNGYASAFPLLFAFPQS